MATKPSGIILQHVCKILTGPETDRLSDRELLRRFTQERDEAAFATLVRRHGPLVLRVGHHILHNAHDAEDVFQATFLVLARKAASRQWHESVGPWLHRVAYRLALKVRAAGARRFSEQQHATEHTSADPLAVVTGRELCGAVDAELSHLAEKWRAPLVLCCLEGFTRDEAARYLGLSLGTFKRRLERGRALLRQRLVRRGFPLSAALAAALGAEQATQAALPTGLAQAAVQTAMGTMLGKAAPAAALVSSRVAALAEGSLQGMGLAKLKTVLAVVLAMCLAGAGVGLAFQQASTAPPSAEKQPPPSATAEAGGRSEPRSPRSRLDRSGDPLPARALARLGTLRFRTGGDVAQIAFSPDGKILASASEDEAVYVWETSTGKLLRRLEDATGYQDAGVAISPDGKLLVAGRYQDLHRWDLATGRELPSFHLREVTTLAVVTFSPDGKILACHGFLQGGDRSKNTIVFLDTASGKELHRLMGLDHYVAPCIAFSRDSTWWAYANKKDRQIWLYDARTGNEIRQLTGHTNAAVTVAISPDGQTLASTDQTGVLRFWEAATGKLLSRTGQFRATNNLTYSPDGKYLVGAGFLSEPHLWDVATGTELNSSAPTHYQGCITISPDGKVLACPVDHTIYLWDMAAGKALHPLQGHRKGVKSMAFAPDGKTLAAACGDFGVLHFWEVITGKELFLPAAIQDYVYAVAYSPDGRLLAVGTGNRDGTLWLLDPAKGKVIRKWTAPEQAITSIALSADGKIMASKYQTQTTLWDTATGSELRRFKATGYSTDNDVALSPDGKTVAEADQDQGMIHVWDVRTGKEVRHWRGHAQGAYAVAFSPDGKMLASGGLDKTVRLWDLATGTELRLMQGHQGWVRFVVFSPDGKTLVSGGQDQSVRLWEVATGQQRCRLDGHRNQVRTGVFSADGRMLATGSADTTALVWNLTNRFELRELSPQELESCWTTLADNDATKAYQSILAFTGSPGRSVAFLRARLRPVAAAGPSRVAPLLAGLESDQFTERQKATRELEQLGFSAEPALRKALRANPSLEVRRRIEAVLEKLAGTPRLRAGRAVETLERIGTGEARELLETLAKGAPGASLTQEADAAVKRLAKARKSP